MWEPKEYSPTLNAENDQTAKDTFIELSGQLWKWKLIAGHDINRPSSHDLVMTTPSGAEVWIEAERKREENWNESGRKNRFPTLNVPYRKNKSKADVYVMFNHHYDTAAVGSMQMIKKALIKGVACEVEGKNIDDLMYDCSHLGFRYYTKIDGRWTEITMYGERVTDDRPSTYIYANKTPFLLGVTI